MQEYKGAYNPVLLDKGFAKRLAREIDPARRKPLPTAPVPVARLFSDSVLLLTQVKAGAASTGKTAVFPGTVAPFRHP